MCAPDMDLGAREVDLDALEVDLVALGVGLGAPGVHLAWVLLPASGALEICHAPPRASSEFDAPPRAGSKTARGTHRQEPVLKDAPPENHPVKTLPHEAYRKRRR